MVRIVSQALLLGVALACSGGGGLANYDPNETDTDTDTDSDADADTDTDTDSDTDTDTDSDTDTDVDTGPYAPTLVSFDARDMGDRIDVAFRVTDPDDDLVGGTLQLTVDGTTFDLELPGDIDYWNPSGESVVSIPVNVCDSGTHNFSGRIYDLAGLSSAQETSSVTLTGSAISVTETGDDSLTATDAGTLVPPVYLCGDLYAASNDATGYTGDSDWIIVEAANSGQWTMTLTWAEMTSDYDLHVVDSYGDPVASSILDGATQPETVDVFMWTGDFYYVIVAGWNGNGGDWTLLIQ